MVWFEIFSSVSDLAGMGMGGNGNELAQNPLFEPQCSISLKQNRRRNSIAIITNTDV